MRRYALSLILAILAGFATGSVRCGEEEEPANPFGPRVAKRSDAIPGLLTRSNGDAFAGRIYLTRDKRLELYSDKDKKWYKLKLKDLASIRWDVEFEKQEREWRWKDSGSDVKVYTGRKKIDRRYKTVAVKKDGTSIEGHLRGTVVYVESSSVKRKYFLYWNHPASFDQKPEDLIYTRRIDFGAAHYPLPEKWSPLSRSQTGLIEPVFARLEKRLAALGVKHPELKGLGRNRKKLESQDGACLTLRTAEDGAGVRFQCQRTCGEKKPAVRPRLTLTRLGLHLSWEVLSGRAKTKTKLGNAARAALLATLKGAADELAKLDAAKVPAKAAKDAGE
jgi:hypothetical protein